MLCSSLSEVFCFHFVAPRSCGHTPKEVIFYRAHFDALLAHLTVEAHEQERVASHMLLEVVERLVAIEEYGERHCGAGL